MRPTIPLDAWRIAVDLETTRAIQHQRETPAYECGCEQCRRWRDIAATALPKSLFDQMYRVGITPERPTDVYSFHRDDDGELYRITFHVAIVFLLPARRGEGGAQRRMRGERRRDASREERPSPGLRPPSPRMRGEGISQSAQCNTGSPTRHD